MYIDSSSVSRNGKTYTRHLLRESYREEGKVKHRTFANLSHCSLEEIEAMRLALRHKKDLSLLGVSKESIKLKQGLSVGSVWVVYDIAKRLGIIDALGSDRQGTLALWQIIARIIDQGSRLSAVRLAGSHAACDVLKLDKFNEKDLYDNLDWLSDNQSKIEDSLFKSQKNASVEEFFLYDVTSSYLEGMKNELAAFGYNRDGKKGKLQIVIGLLCDISGRPVSIEVFHGNTLDQKTFFSQVNKVAERFGGKGVTFVGDRGMIKNFQIDAIKDEQFHYITAITKPQIESLVKSNILQMSLFDELLVEVETFDEIRYVIRRNPIRAQEISQSRDSKYQKLVALVEERNQYLVDHQRASTDVALRNLTAFAKKLKIDKWTVLLKVGEFIRLTIDQCQADETSKLDGCYALKTDLSKQAANKEIVHSRYKDLSLVEKAFRESKTSHLELRPIFVRLEKRTRGHAFIVMLAYLIIKELSRVWHSIDIKVEEGIDQLSSLCLTEAWVNGRTSFNLVPEPRPEVKCLLNAAGIRMPDVLPSKNIVVATKRKLTKSRKST